MDIVAIQAHRVLGAYNRQEKLADARKSAESRLIKTAVAERISISNDALSILSLSAKEPATQAAQVQTTIGVSRVARQYQRNQPDSGQPADKAVGDVSEADAAPETERTSSVKGADAGKTDARTNQVAQQAQVRDAMAQIPRASYYPFPIPRELRAYISNLPAKDRPNMVAKPGQSAKKAA